MKKNKYNVFVYGSLRKDLSEGRTNLIINRYMEDCVFRGTFKTEPYFSLLDLGSFPGVVEGGGTSIVGDVFEIDDRTLMMLDRIESHPDFYKRSEIFILGFGYAWIYILQKRWGILVKSGDWKKYLEERR